MKSLLATCSLTRTISSISHAGAKVGGPLPCHRLYKAAMLMQGADLCLRRCQGIFSVTNRLQGSQQLEDHWQTTHRQYRIDRRPSKPNYPGKARFIDRGSILPKLTDNSTQFWALCRLFIPRFKYFSCENRSHLADNFLTNLLIFKFIY